MQNKQSGKRPPKQFFGIGPFVESFSHSRQPSFDDSEFTSGDESEQKRFSISKDACFKFSIAFSAFSSFAIAVLLFFLLNNQPNDINFISAIRFAGPYDGDESNLLKECNEALKELKCTSVNKGDDDDFVIRFENRESGTKNAATKQNSATEFDADSLYKALFKIQEEGLKLPTNTLYPKQKRDNITLKASIDDLKAKLEKCEKQNVDNITLKASVDDLKAKLENCKRKPLVKSLEHAERNKNLETELQRAKDEIKTLLEKLEIWEKTSEQFELKKQEYERTIWYLNDRIIALEIEWSRLRKDQSNESELDEILESSRGEQTNENDLNEIWEETSEDSELSEFTEEELYEEPSKYLHERSKEVDARVYSEEKDKDEERMPRARKCSGSSSSTYVNSPDDFDAEEWDIDSNDIIGIAPTPVQYCGLRDTTNESEQLFEECIPYMKHENGFVSKDPLISLLRQNCKPLTVC